jgi:hypothetical protein
MESFFVGRGVHVILRKVSPCTIEDNVFGEYHSLCTLKTSYFVYFQNRSVGAFLSLQQTNISAPTQLSILFQWQSKVDLVDPSPQKNMEMTLLSTPLGRVALWVWTMGTFTSFHTLHCIQKKKHKYYIYVLNNNWNNGRDRMVVGFTTTYVVNAYHH